MANFRISLAMLLVAIFAFAAAVSGAKSSGCGKAVPSGMKKGGLGSSNRISFKTTSGTTRSFLLHIPTSYSVNSATGLIFSFHGHTQTGAEQERLSQFSDESFNPNMLAVYPDGLNGEWQGDPDAKTDDVGFTLDMIKSLSASYCIDSTKIFAAGKSNGGGFAANILACDPIATTKIAAFAGISGAYYQGNSSANCDAASVPIACSPGRKNVPIFETHGSADTVIPYDGGARRSRCLPTIPHFMTNWAELNGLGSSNVTTDLYSGDVKKYEFGKSSGLEGIDTHYWVKGLGHAWPSTKPNDDGPGTFFNATPLIMDVFNEWTLNKAPGALAASSSVAKSTSKASASSSKASASSYKASAKASQSSASVAKASAAASASTSATSAGSIVCSAANGTIYRAASGDDYGILCGYDTSAAYFDVVYGSGNFANCIAECETKAECGHVVYNGVCYLKKMMVVPKKVSSQDTRVAVKLSYAGSM